jgi:hypothetical protein
MQHFLCIFKIVSIIPEPKSLLLCVKGEIMEQSNLLLFYTFKTNSSFLTETTSFKYFTYLRAKLILN